MLRVRGDQDEIYRAILELNEAQFVETSTREEFAHSLKDQPAEIRDRRLADDRRAANCMEAPHVIEARCRSILRKRSRATSPGF